jgi:hypothetical protein
MRVCQFRHFGSETSVPPEGSSGGQALRTAANGLAQVLSLLGEFTVNTRAMMLDL